MVDQKTQYYPSDLSTLLCLGEIVDMYVADDSNGNQVLRITSRDPESDDNYITVRAGRGKQPQRKQLPAKSQRVIGKGHPGEEREGLLPGAIHAFLGTNKEKPPWMD
jgi:hypothetical protein